MTSNRVHIASGLLGGLAAFAAWTGVAMVLNAGRFEYALDDAYIHLAMAEQIFAGGYGVNPGEYASAASSPLYPLLLPTWAGMDVQVWLPLVWNVAFLASASALLGWAIAQARIPRLGPVLAAFAPLALTLPLVASTGMENLGHGAASLAIVIGLWRFVETGRIPALLLLGVVLAPAFRLEGLALALAAGGVLLLMGRPVAGLGVGALAMAPVVLFTVILTRLGLDPLPNSVNAKLPNAQADESGFLGGALSNFNYNIDQPGGLFVFALMLAVGLIGALSVARGARGLGLIGLAVAAAAAAHLAVASVGWLDRYENYLVLSLVASLALLVATSNVLTRTTVLLIALFGGAATYVPQFDDFIYNPRAIALQQGQMARFAKDHLKAPVAVNDLGYVAWNNPNHVLDLWGLASAEALERRVSDAAPGWADTLAEQHDVRVAMIYDRVLAEALGPDWVPLGQLLLETEGGPFLGGAAVSFYAINATEARGLQADIRDWAAGLPPGASFLAAGGV